MCIGGILQRSATTRPQQQRRDRPALSQSKSLRSNNKRDEIKDVDGELRFAMQRVWAVLDSPSANTTEVKIEVFPTI
jgi:hypothetical protein